MKRTTVFIDPQLERELQALARRHGRPTAALVREAVAQYVAAARRKRPARLAFIGAGRSGRQDIADRHEDLLFEPGAGKSAARPAKPEPAKRPRGIRQRRSS